MKSCIIIMFLLSLAACSQGFNTVSKPDFDKAHAFCISQYKAESGAHDPHALGHNVQCMTDKVMPYWILIYPEKKDKITETYTAMQLLADKADNDGSGPKDLEAYFHQRAQEIGLRYEIFCPKPPSAKPCVLGPLQAAHATPHIKAW